jgi:hypothetical protein
MSKEHLLTKILKNSLILSLISRAVITSNVTFLVSRKIRVTRECWQPLRVIQKILPQFRSHHNTWRQTFLRQNKPEFPTTRRKIFRSPLEVTRRFSGSLVIVYLSIRSSLICTKSTALKRSRTLAMSASRTQASWTHTLELTAISQQSFSLCRVFLSRIEFHQCLNWTHRCRCQVLICCLCSRVRPRTTSQSIVSCHTTQTSSIYKTSRIRLTLGNIMHLHIPPFPLDRE